MYRNRTGGKRGSGTVEAHRPQAPAARHVITAAARPDGARRPQARPRKRTGGKRGAAPSGRSLDALIGPRVSRGW